MRTRFALIWIAFNLAGVAVFLAVASDYWVEPEVADIPGASIGNAFGWFLYAVPILGACVLANLLWLMRAVRNEPVARWWWPVLLFVAMLGCWVVAYLFDNAHHGI